MIFLINRSCGFLIGILLLSFSFLAFAQDIPTALSQWISTPQEQESPEYRASDTRFSVKTFFQQEVRFVSNRLRGSGHLLSDMRTDRVSGYPFRPAIQRIHDSVFALGIRVTRFEENYSKLDQTKRNRAAGEIKKQIDEVRTRVTDIGLFFDTGRSDLLPTDLVIKAFDTLTLYNKLMVKLYQVRLTMYNDGVSLDHHLLPVSVNDLVQKFAVAYDAKSKDLDIDYRDLARRSLIELRPHSTRMEHVGAVEYVDSMAKLKLFMFLVKFVSSNLEVPLMRIIENDHQSAYAFAAIQLVIPYSDPRGVTDAMINAAASLETHSHFILFVNAYSDRFF